MAGKFELKTAKKRAVSLEFIDWQWPNYFHERDV